MELPLTVLMLLNLYMFIENMRENRKITKIMKGLTDDLVSLNNKLKEEGE